MNFDANLQAQIARTRRHGLGELLWRSAQRVPAKTALVYRDQRWTYTELDTLVNRMAHALFPPQPVAGTTARAAAPPSSSARRCSKAS